MVKHIILWTLKEELKGDELISVKEGIKDGLQGLKGKIDGLIDIKVNTEGLETSNVSLMLDSTFESFAALKAYSTNPLHVEVADNFVRPYTQNRACFDFEV